MLEFVKKDSEGKEWNVRITSTHPYGTKKYDDTVYCFIYQSIQLKEKKRKHWWNILKTEEYLETYDRIYFHESMNLEDVLDWSKETFEGWAGEIVKRYERQREKRKKEKDIKNIIGD